MAVTGPDFISLQVRDLERSAAFYERYLGLKRSPARRAGQDHPDRPGSVGRGRQASPTTCPWRSTR
jgi:catechol 2,3-dioxygenase-like lactoylglutathione lyase family enzyme